MRLERVLNMTNSSSGGREPDAHGHSCSADETHDNRRLDAIRIALSGVAILFTWFELIGSAGSLMFLGILCVGFSGFPIFKHAFSALAKKRMTMELSMTIAIIAALAVAEVLTALVIVFFVLIAEEIEKMTIKRGRNSIKTLLDLLPRTALVIRNGGTKEISLGSLSKGDVVLVKPGSRIAVDGTVKSGNSFIDESPITGESMPVEKLPGSKVFAGSVNQSGALEVVTEEVGEDTAFGKIVQAVEQADKSRAQIERTADRLAGYLVYFAVIAAAVTFFVTWDVKQTISVIIVTGACGIAAGTPLANLGAIGRAAQRGSIIKGGLYLERLGTIDTVVFDKTGTLTVGSPKVVSILPGFGYTPDAVLGAAASAESLSEHPLGEAIIEAARQAGIAIEQPSGFEYVPGRGIVCTVSGAQVAVGNKELFEERKIAEIDNHQPCRHLSEVMVARNGKMIGRIHVADSIRPEAKRVIDELRALGIKTVMMTGDTVAIGTAVARQLGIDDFAAGLRPDDKRRRVAELVEEGHLVAMIGDGVNDAPALTEATVGVAIGSGTDVAIESADIVLIGNDLTRFVEAVKIARQARRVIWANFFGTVAIDAAGMALAFMGMLNPLLAAFVHVGSEVIFLANSARLLPFFSRRKA